MLKSNLIWGSFIRLVLLFGMTQMTFACNLQSEPDASVRFRKIEQSLPLKVGVTLGGMALIMLEAWWFLASKNKAQSTQIDREIQDLDSDK